MVRQTSGVWSPLRRRRSGSCRPKKKGSSISSVLEENSGVPESAETKRRNRYSRRCRLGMPVGPKVTHTSCQSGTTKLIGAFRSRLVAAHVRAGRQLGVKSGAVEESRSSIDTQQHAGSNWVGRYTRLYAQRTGRLAPFWKVFLQPQPYRCVRLAGQHLQDAYATAFQHIPSSQRGLTSAISLWQQQSSSS